MKSYQPSRIDLSRMRDLRAAINELPAGQNPMQLALPELHRLFRLDNGCAHALKVVNDRHRLGIDFFIGTGLAPERITATRAYLNSAYARTSWGQGSFNALRPDPRQRNVFLTSAEAVRFAGGWRSRTLRARRVFPVAGMPMDHQLRTLICDRDVFLGYLTLGRSVPFSPPERALAARLVPSLRRRLLLNRQVVPVDLLAAFLEASLDAVGSPAFITTTSGQVLHANVAGRTLLSAERRGIQELLAVKAREPLAESAVTTRIAVSGLPEYRLVILRNDEQRFLQLAARAAIRWGLTRRQSEVLSLVVRGLANASIGQLLGCVEHTVALHVSAILDRAGVDSRSALVAAVGMLA